MKLSIMLAGLPAVAVASVAIAQISTITVIEPVATQTHTNIVFVTAAAGADTSTSLLSLSGVSNGTSGNLSTIQLTSSITTTTTEVVTPPDATTTIIPVPAPSEASASVPTSCAMQTPATITFTVTETSIPVITRSVYPLPATNVTRDPETRAPVSATVMSSSAVMNITQPIPPFRNVTTTSFMAGNSSIVTMPLVSKVVGGAPDNVLSLGIPASQTSYSVNTEHGSITSTEGAFPTSAGRTIAPPRLFTLFAKILSLAGHVKAQLANPAMAVNAVQNLSTTNGTHDVGPSIVYVTSTGTSVLTIKALTTVLAAPDISVSGVPTMTVTVSLPAHTTTAVVTTYVTANTTIKSFYQHTETLLTTMTQNATGFEKVLGWNLFVGGVFLALAM